MMLFIAGQSLYRTRHSLLPSKHWLYGFCLLALTTLSSVSTATSATLHYLNWQFASDPVVLNEPLPHYNGRYHLAYPQAGAHLHRTGIDSRQGLAQLLNELQMPLLLTSTLHPEQEPIAGLAIGWALDPKAQQVIFKLDNNAQWSDGQPLTGQDFTYSYKYLNADEYPWLINLRTIDDLLIFQLTDIAWEGQNIHPSIWRQLISFKPLAAHFHRQDGEDPSEIENRYEPTSGAYSIQRWQPEKYIVLQRTDNWWAKNRLFFRYRFAFEHIKLSLLTNSSEALNLLRYGDIDAMPIRATDNNSQAKITALQKEKNIHLQIFQGIEGLFQEGIVVRDDRLQYLSSWLTPDHSSSPIQAKTLRIGYHLPIPNELQALVVKARLHGIDLIPLAHPLERLRQWTQEPNSMQLDMIWLTSNQIDNIPLHSTLKLILRPPRNESLFLFWPWLHRVQPLPVSSQAKTFYAWNLHDGGLMWLNPEERSRVLLHSAPNQPTRIHTIEVGKPLPIMNY